MRIKYYSRPVLKQTSNNDDDEYYDDFEEQEATIPTVNCWEPYVSETGLLDMDGNPIVKHIQPNPIGYIWPEDDNE